MADILKVFENMDELYKLQDKQRETMNELRRALMLKHTFPDLKHPVTISMTTDTRLERINPLWAEVVVTFLGANEEVNVNLLDLPFILWPRRVQDVYNRTHVSRRPKNVDMTGMPR